MMEFSLSRVKKLDALKLATGLRRSFQDSIVDSLLFLFFLAFDAPSAAISAVS